MKNTRYICLEGTEGVGKGTQTDMLIEYLRSKGYSVLHTKEPGTPHLPLTQTLRGVMLNNKYEKPENVGLLIQDLENLIKDESVNFTSTALKFIKKALASIKEEQKMSLTGRELVSQAIRSIHLEKLIKESMGQYDFIIQDRGILSGMAYGEACGNPISGLRALAATVTGESHIRPRDIIQKTLIKLKLMREYSDVYDYIIYLNGNSKKGLETAQGAKQEFTDGDAMELKGNSFMENVANNFKNLRKEFNAVAIVEVHEEVEEDLISDSDMKTIKVLKFRDKNIIFNEIKAILGV